jgi:hypothetical protein
MRLFEVEKVIHQINPEDSMNMQGNVLELTSTNTAIGTWS